MFARKVSGLASQPTEVDFHACGNNISAKESLCKHKIITYILITPKTNPNSVKQVTNFT